MCAQNFQQKHHRPLESHHIHTKDKNLKFTIFQQEFVEVAVTTAH